MRILSSISIIIFQLFITSFILFATYIIFALLDMTEIDMITEIGFVIFQPILGAIISLTTIIICLLIGLPIRLVPKVYKYWTHKPFIVIVSVTIGAILLLLSLNNNFTETTIITIDDQERTKIIPNYYLALTGWFLVAFNLLHFYPMSIINWVKNKNMKTLSDTAES